jgi:hypothetical protein
MDPGAFTLDDFAFPMNASYQAFTVDGFQWLGQSINEPPDHTFNVPAVTRSFTVPSVTRTFVVPSV